MKYKILSHTADLRLEIYGQTIKELFINGTEAIAHILMPKINPHTKRELTPTARKDNHSRYGVGVKEKISTGLRDEIKIKSFNQNTLLADFLNELLSKSQINKAVYFVEEIKIDGNNLEAIVSGIKVDKFEKDIKAVTYHEIDVKKEGDLWKTKLVLDI